MIGIAVKNRAVAGVIHQPYFRHSDGTEGRTIWGVKGLGIGGVDLNSIDGDKLVITTTRSHSNEVVQEAIEALSPKTVLKVGGAGYKVLQLLEGKANVYLFASRGCKRWDTCAPEAILEAASGSLTDILGRHYSYAANVHPINCEGVLATSASISHAEIVDKIPDSVKDYLSKQ